MSAVPIATRSQLLVRIGDAEYDITNHREWSDSDESTASVVNGPNGPIGVSTTPGGYSHTLTKVTNQTKEPVNWDLLKLGQTPFEFVFMSGFEFEGDFIPLVVRTYKNCYVASVGHGHSSGDSPQDDIAFVSSNFEYEDKRPEAE